MTTPTALETCTIDDIGIEIAADAPLIDAINEYLKDFAKPVKHAKVGIGQTVCLNCDHALDGVLGSFRGLEHGEGECSHCGWPCRVYHGRNIDMPLQLILQYHPSVVPAIG